MSRRDEIRHSLEADAAAALAWTLRPLLLAAERDLATLHPAGTPLSTAPLFLADRIEAAGLRLVRDDGGPPVERDPGRCCTRPGCRCRYAPSRREAIHDHRRSGCDLEAIR